MTDGYFLTPNLMIPGNDRDSGEIAPLALVELAKWQIIAESWGVYPDGKARRCMKCDQSIWFICDPHGEQYVYSDEEINALTVAHIRQVHAEVINAGIQADNRDSVPDMGSAIDSGQADRNTHGGN